MRERCLGVHIPTHLGVLGREIILRHHVQGLSLRHWVKATASVLLAERRQYRHYGHLRLDNRVTRDTLIDN